MSEVFIPVAGIYRDPQGQSVPLATLTLVSRRNTWRVSRNMCVSQTTAEDGSYAFSLVPDVYDVGVIYSDGQREKLGTIELFVDSIPGTLNEYLACFHGDDASPAILAEMQEILAETRQVASSAGVVPRGEYSPDAEYAMNDLVQYEGSEYRATEDILGIIPPSYPWELFVSRGEQGEKGENGPANNLTVGTVETLPPDEPATVSVTGDSPEQIVNFGIPQGEKGDSGDAGPANVLTVGDVDTLEPGEPVVVTIAGDSPAQVLSFGIPQGKKGEPGDIGPANNLTIGDTETLAPDEPATVTITGDAPEQVINFGIPQGEKGNTGDAGPGNKLAVGDVATLEPGEQATVTITGESPDQVLNFGIPRGESSAVPEFGAPGDSGMFYHKSDSDIKPGELIAGSQLIYTSIGGDETDAIVKFIRYGVPKPSGTWRVNGYFASSGSTATAATLCLRVDDESLISHSAIRQNSVRNCRYVASDSPEIDCEVLMGGKWMPFTASPDDPAGYGREIFSNAQAGMYGNVKKPEIMS